MKKIISLSFLLFTFLIFGQEVEKRNDNTGIGEATYYVLKSDMSTKHGEYSIEAYSRNTILMSGTYIKGKKDGKWTERYFRKERNLKSIGDYKNNNKIGKWTFYNTNGEIIQEYDFDKKELISSTECNTNILYEVYINDVKTRAKLDCPASYIGGKDALLNELLKEISESFKFDKNDKEQTYVKFQNLISFLVDENGNLEDLIFYDKVEIPHLKEFVKNEILSKKGMWIPGELNGARVKSNVDLFLSITASIT